MSRGVRRSLSSLAVQNYRRYFFGQAVSISGTWMQNIAEAWLVLKLTGSGFALGTASALQFLPLLLLGAWGGVLADRLAKRRLMTITQTLMAAPALALWALTLTGAVQLWMVYALILARGLVTAIDNPARQSFVSEMVGEDRVVNAVSLNSVLVQTARIAGPAAAALVIATAGIATCFLLNALSFGAMILALRRMDPRELTAPPRAPRGSGQLREALGIVMRTPELRIPLAMMAVVGTLAFNFPTVLPLLARFTFGGDATTYALLTGFMGAGAVAGALVNGARARASLRLVSLAAIAFGAALALVAAAPSLPVAVGALVLVGAASVTFSAGVNALLQLAAAPELRGRVMALYAIVFLGTTPIGAPLVGWISQAAGARAGLAVGGAAAAMAGAAALWSARRRREAGLETAPVAATLAGELPARAG